VVAARHLSFVRAADDLHVTPAAVGQQIRQLEAHLSVSLFHRNGRQLELTEEGAALLPGLIDAFESMVKSVSKIKAPEEKPALGVSVAPSFAAKWLVPRLKRFNALQPALEVRIGVSMALVDFTTEDVDCAIRFGTGVYPELFVEKLFDESVFPVCSPALLEGEHPVDRPEMLEHHVLLHDDSNMNDPGYPDWRMWFRAAGLTKLNPDQGTRFDQSALVIEAAIAGQGVALAHASLVDSDLQSGRLIRPFGNAQRTAFAYYFVCPPHKLELNKVQTFRMWLQTETETRWEHRAEKPVNINDV